MDVSLFVQGIIIGLTLAVPVGLCALICIQRTVSEGRLHGIFSGIGVATADSFYAAVTFLGLTVISGLDHRPAISFPFPCRGHLNPYRHTGFPVNPFSHQRKDRA